MVVTPKLGSPIKLPSNFVKSGSPYNQLNCFFISLSLTWGLVSTIKFSKGSHLAYIKERDLQAEDFKETSHPNLVNLKEVFIAKQNIFFLYNTWALKYMHEVLGICHRNVTPSTVLINQEGIVKLGFIADVRSSLIRELKRQQKSKDLQAVYLIAYLLLRLDETSAIYGTMGLLAEDFTRSSGRATAADLLKINSSQLIKISILSYALAWD
ncbi:hypothetical protein GB937_010640 [Aspergillus fischeri]|nr:hypothetical protein GB937_010640 [Aspergillus fischeri]